LEIGTTSYLYDDNGNLTLQIPPNGSSWLHYAFNQRNLMISHTLSISGTSPQLQAAYSYDGSSNRVQQVDHTGTTPITTTYTNDIVGLAQVLVADDGTAQTHLLFGLDLISQDDGNATRYLLADGLGSVRVEMVDDAVATATTYEPFGNVLQQAGSRGTVYGFTGEQYDTSTEQLYLRARYYNPTLHAFMGKDPWSGNFVNPQSMNGWSYVNNNPVNLMDPTGNIPFRAEYCKTSKAFYEYRDCVSGEYGLIWDIQIEVAPFDYQGEPGCWYGPVPYRTRGYTEGTAFTYAILGGYTNGDETVYDFATMERQAFRYHGGGLFAEVGGGVTQYAGVVHGFRSWKPTATEIGATSRRIVEDYKGWFKFDYTGGGPPTEILGVTGGKMNFEGRPDTSVYGSATYASLGIGLSTGYDRGEGFTFYRPLGHYTDQLL
jgi:RHS repeat-associated protein